MTNNTSRYTMTINGKAVAATGAIDVVNPATGRVFEQAPAATAVDIEHAVAAAQAAFPKWRAMTWDARRKIVVQAADVLAAHADELAQIFTSEMGRPLEFAKQEILGASFWMKALSKLELPIEVTEDSPARRVEVHHEPLGVVCAIVPWNFPVLLASWKIAHATLTGNALVLKPSPFTPLATLKIGEILRGVFPDGVFNVISGGDELGPLMTAHPGFAKISFTGSTATGRRIMESAAHDLKRVTLELGGNDAAIIMSDVDVDEVAPKVFMGAFLNSGQVCVATKRLYVHDKVYDAMFDKLRQMTTTSKVGNGAEAGVMFGPIQNRPQYLRVKNLVEDARASGLKIHEGGPVPSEGYFIPLTLVDNPPEKSRVVIEEAFGPVLPVLRFTDVDDVIARANDTEYGLSSVVWSKDMDLAMSVAHRLDAGTVFINDNNLNAAPGTPLGGHKKSGFGVENGVAGLMEFTQLKAIYIPKAAAAS